MLYLNVEFISYNFIFFFSDIKVVSYFFLLGFWDFGLDIVGRVGLCVVFLLFVFIYIYL